MVASLGLPISAKPDTLTPASLAVNLLTSAVLLASVAGTVPVLMLFSGGVMGPGIVVDGASAREGDWTVSISESIVDVLVF